MSSHMSGKFSNQRGAPPRRSRVNMDDLSTGSRTARTKDVPRYGLQCGKLVILPPGAPGRTAPVHMIPLPERSFVRQLRRLARIEDADTPQKVVAAVARFVHKYRQLAQDEGHDLDNKRWFLSQVRNVVRWWKNAKANGAQPGSNAQ